MALSGSANGGGGTGGSYLRFEWDASQNIGNNTSTINGRLYLVLQGGTSLSASENGDINIDGSANGYSRGTTSRGTNTTSLVHSYSHTISHTSDGTRSFGASGYFDSGWSGFPTISVSGSWSLDTIPRYAVITGYTRTAITDQAFTTNVTTDTTCDILQYSLNGGAWTTNGSGTFTSRSFTLTGLASDVDYTIKVRVRRQSSGLYTESSTQTVRTLGQNNFMDFFDTE